MTFSDFLTFQEQTLLFDKHFLNKMFYSIETIDFFCNFTEFSQNSQIFLPSDFDWLNAYVLFNDELVSLMFSLNIDKHVKFTQNIFYYNMLYSNLFLLHESVFFNGLPFSFFDDNFQFSDTFINLIFNSSKEFVWTSFDFNFDDSFINFHNVDLISFGEKAFSNIFYASQPNSLITDLQLDDLSYLDNLTNIAALYHYSIPNTKLAYPEPFIASASFMHSDLWFAHILIYQYWLWFIFIFLIVFFFLTFITVVRWCNMRVRPRRETRGVSRSKCGDLITACVPVSWATSIIVNESTDAIDFYDGFGTTELVVGVRAYQWGWEYYYPKDIDLNYNIKKNYSTFIGNSIKYNSTSALHLKTNNLWKFYQNKSLDNVVTPAHFLLSSSDNYKLLNFLNFNDLGSNILNESSAFKKTKSFFKSFVSNNTYHYSLFNSHYKNISNLYFNDFSFLNSHTYGLKRHHNYLSFVSNNGSHSTYLNAKPFLKFLDYNYNFEKNSLLSNKHSINVLNTKYSSIFSLFNLYFNKILTKHDFSHNFFLFSSIQTHTSSLSLINNDSDLKKTNYPVFKLLNLFKFSKKLNNKNSFINLISNENFFFSKKNNLNNQNDFNKKFTSYSNDQSISTNSKSIRAFANLSPYITDKNLKFASNNFLNNLSISNSVVAINLFSTYNIANTNWIDPFTFIKLSINKIYFDSPVSPLLSNNINSQSLEFDNCKNTFIENVPTILQGKEDSLPSFLLNTYWNFYWNNMDNSQRFSDNLSYYNIMTRFAFPLFNLSYDYDFRNWQSLELMEDSFWESTFSFYLYDEYLNIFDDFYLKPINSSAISYNENKLNFLESQNIFSIYNELTKNSHYTNVFYFDEFISSVNLNISNDFALYSFLINITNIDDTYESSKFFPEQNFKYFLNFSTNFFQPYSYSLITNMFRSDFEDFNWFFDNEKAFTICFLTDAAKKIINEINNNLFCFEKLNTNKTFNFFLENTSRFDNSFNLRSTTKNSMVSYNALQKVFRTRFDEGRSNTKILDFTNFYSKQPYLSSSRVSYENTLGKNKTNFYKINFYKTNFYNNFNVFYNLATSLNYYIFDFPFLLAAKSDASRYSWFDWFAKWDFYEVQPSSSARYAIHGLPHFNKFFNFASTQNDTLNESETYLLRLNKARKNYLPGWTYTPYFYAKNNQWFKINSTFNNFHYIANNLETAQNLLNESHYYLFNTKISNFVNINFFPATTNINSYTKNLWKPTFSAAGYYFNISNLLDILTKREYLYHQFLNKNNKLKSLPVYLSNHPQNDLLNEIKTMFNFVDPLLCVNEYSRDYYYNSLKIFNFYLLNNLFDTNTTFSKFSEFFFFYLFNNDKKDYLNTNTEIYKNQYRPLRKGINNMLRLHATGAIAMPIEIRLQILASSKDVIHSWAIPSAGIKIDCVPGYSSHKVMIFLVSGIFWGQCMEICGRYHHWMPIVVYFMKRDLFFLWCTHFVFSSHNTTLNINDKQFVDYVKLVSYDKNSWLNELIS